MVDGILVVDERGKVVSANQKFVEIWRVPSELVAAGDDEALLRYAVSQLESPEVFLARVRYLYEHPSETGSEDIRLADGRIFERWTGPVRGPAHSILGRLWCFRDVTERRRMDTERALVTERMASMGRIAAGVGHEINNPLAYVMGNVEWLEHACASQRAGGRSVSLEALSDVVASTRDGLNRIRTIVGDLQSLTRGDDDVRAFTDVAALLEQSLQIATSEIRHRAHVVRRFESDAHVLGSPARLGQLFLNLLVNAAHAIPEGFADDNSITVRCRTERETVVVDVVDTGHGIAEEHLARVFDPFFTTKDIGSGSGLGLSICKRIVEEHGGTLTVTSRRGEGATFRVSLPSVSAQPSAALPTRLDDTPAGRARVLVIDDEPMLLTMLSRLLSNRYEVMCSEGAHAALARLSSGETFDVILCDLMMRNMTGMDFQETIVRTYPTLADRIVFMTGGAFTPRATALVESGAHEVIGKPFKLPEVLAVIDRVAGRSD